MYIVVRLQARHLPQSGCTNRTSRANREYKEFKDGIRLSRLGVGESCSIGGGCRALRTESFLHFFPPHPPSLPLVPLRALPNPGRLSGDGVRFQAIPKRLFSEAVLRPSAREDRIVPFGAEYTKPLRTFLSARGTEPSFRPYYPVLALGSEVIWVPGAGAGEKARVRPEEESVALYYPGFLPGDMDEAVPESADTEV